MGEIYANNAKGKLALAVSDTATTLELEAGHNLPALATGDWFRLTLYRWEFWGEGVREYDHEVVKVTAVETNTLTVERALEGAAQAFDAGTNAELRPTAGTVDAMRADAKAYTDTHSGRTDNPHGVTAAQVGATPDTHPAETETHGAPVGERLVHTGDLGTAAAQDDTRYMRRDSADSATARHVYTNTVGEIGSATGHRGQIEVRASEASGNAAMLAFHRAGSHAQYFGLDHDNKWKVGGWSAGDNAYEVHHDDNSTKYNPTVSTSPPSGGGDGDIWYEVD